MGSLPLAKNYLGMQQTVPCGASGLRVLRPAAEDVCRRRCHGDVTARLKTIGVEASSTEGERYRFSNRLKQARGGLYRLS